MPYADPAKKREAKNRWVKTPAGRAYQARQRQRRNEPPPLSVNTAPLAQTLKNWSRT
jgi:hypothetical protein